MLSRRELVEGLQLIINEIKEGRSIELVNKEDADFVYAAIVQIDKASTYETVLRIIAKYPMLPRAIMTGKTHVEFIAQNLTAKVSKEQYELVSKVLRGNKR